MKNIVVFTGSGISAESGIATFRGGSGLWDNMPVENVCTPEALLRNRDQLIGFYNRFRRKVYACQPNEGHMSLVKLESKYHVEVITQNVDDLHERAGSTHITHLHGEITKLRSSKNPNGIVPCDGIDQPLDARHPDGSLLRPHIVFFGEDVPNMERAIEITSQADIFIVVGTSLVVYPAASLLQFVRHDVPIYIVDPGELDLSYFGGRITHFRENASTGVPMLVERLLKEE